MEEYKIKKANACYTGGGLYVYYGQLENGLYFRAYDEWESIYICNANTSIEDADYDEFYEQYTVEEITGKQFKIFWNQIINHILNKGAGLNEYNNYSTSDLEKRIIK